MLGQDKTLATASEPTRKKIAKEAVVYMGPQLNRSEFTCKGCALFIVRRTEGDQQHGWCEVLQPPEVNDIDGCTLYVPGKSQRGKVALRLVPATVAGLTQGPFTCKRCEHFGGHEDSPGPCEVVEGTVHPDGCCNAWEAD